jgi:hypothetical protein
VGIGAIWLLIATLLGAGQPVLNTQPNAVLGVHGNQLVSRGHVVRLLGVQPQGLESNCLTKGLDYFEGPHDQSAADAIKGWGANTVRVPINESCWLGAQGTRSDPTAYRNAVTDWVKLLLHNGLFVVIDSHTATDGTIPADALPMPDMSAVNLWQSLAQTFQSSAGVVFDLYNEPYGVSWSCWRDGCQVPAAGSPVAHQSYLSPGLQALIDVVRISGAHQPIMLGGLQWANDNSGWAGNAPTDPDNQLIVSEHTYGASPTNEASPCEGSCRATLAQLAATHPVVTGELGEVDCGHDYIDDYMSWADAHGIGYIGGAFNAIADGSYQCESPALLADYAYPDPAPSPYGVGLRDHLRALAGL